MAVSPMWRELENEGLKQVYAACRDNCLLCQHKERLFSLGDIVFIRQAIRRPKQLGRMADLP